MQITVTAKGPTLDRLVADTARDLKRANRTAGRDVVKAGKKAMDTGAPRMFGKRLKVKGEVEAWATRVAVEFYPSPGSAGGWAIAESGAGPHLIDTRNRKALKFGGRFAAVVHHPGAGGRAAWTKAGRRLADALDRTIDDVYDEALGD